MSKVRGIPVLGQALGETMNALTLWDGSLVGLLLTKNHRWADASGVWFERSRECQPQDSMGRGQGPFAGFESADVCGARRRLVDKLAVAPARRTNAATASGHVLRAALRTTAAARLNHVDFRGGRTQRAPGPASSLTCRAVSKCVHEFVTKLTFSRHISCQIRAFPPL